MIFEIAQIGIAIALVVLILLQERSAGMSGLFGGGGGDGGIYQTRRGLERIVFWATIVLLVAFVVLALLQIIW